MPDGTDDRALREEYGALIDQMMGVVEQTQPKQPPIVDFEDAKQALAELRRLAKEGTDELGRAIWLLRGLGDNPRAYIKALGVVGELATTKGDKALALHVYAKATVEARKLGDQESMDRFLSFLMALSTSGVWSDYARAMERSKIEAVSPDHIEGVADFHLFRGASVGICERLQSHAQLRRFKGGEYLCMEGNPAEELLLLKQGEVAVLQDIHGRERFVALRNSGATIGEMALMSPEGLRTASCMAVTDTEVWVLAYAVLKEVLDDGNGGQQLRNQFQRVYHRRRVETRISQHPWLHSLNIAQRARLASLVEAEHTPEPLHPGQLLVKGGTPLERVFLLLDGAVELSLGEGESAYVVEKLVACQRTFPWFGLEALLGVTSWAGDVRASTDHHQRPIETWIATISLEALREFAAEQPELLHSLPAQLIDGY